MKGSFTHQTVIVFFETDRILIIVVHIKNIRFYMETAAGIDTGTGGIHGFGHLIHHTNAFVIGTTVAFIPGFVMRAPTDDGRVIKVTFDLFHPFGKNAVDIILITVIQSPVWVFTPNKISHLVSVIQKPFFKDLFVQTGTVISQCHRKFDIFLKIFIGGGGINTVGIKALIQNQTLKNTLTVDQEFHSVQLHLTQTEITLYPIFTKGKGNIIQISLTHLPQMLLFQRNIKTQMTRRTFCLITAHSFAVKKDLTGEILKAAKLGFHRYTAIGNIGIVFYPLYMIFRHKLQPYRLPDACGTGIGTTGRMIFAALFTRRDQTVPCIILCIHTDLIFSLT